MMTCAQRMGVVQGQDRHCLQKWGMTSFKRNRNGVYRDRLQDRSQARLIMTPFTLNPM